MKAIKCLIFAALVAASCTAMAQVSTTGATRAIKSNKSKAVASKRLASVRYDIKKGQTDTTAKDNKVYDVVEQQPSFPGGMGALNSWLANNIRYPAVAVEQRVEGRVIVQFVVERDGSVSGVRVVHGVDSSLDKEAVRVVSRMPKWIPGKHHGSAVRVKYTVPVTFRL